MELLRFDGQVAIITGAGGGLGREHALLLAERGASVVCNDLGTSPEGEGQDESLARSVVAEIVDLGGIAVAETSSVATPEGGSAVVQTALDAFGRVDILVNNAAVMSRSPFEDLPPNLVDRTFSTNLIGTVNVTRPAWRIMRQQHYGRIVMTASNAGWIGTGVGVSHYGASKLALVGLTRCLAQEGEPIGIRVNAIAPRAATRHSAGDLPEAKLVSPVVAWLSHPDCTNNGELFAVSAGRVSKVFFALTPGFAAPNLSPEDVARNIDTVIAETGYLVPRTGNEEALFMLRHLQGKGAKTDDV